MNFFPSRICEAAILSDAFFPLSSATVGAGVRHAARIRAKKKTMVSRNGTLGFIALAFFMQLKVATDLGYVKRDDHPLR